MQSVKQMPIFTLLQLAEQPAKNLATCWGIPNCFTLTQFVHNYRKYCDNEIAHFHAIIQVQNTHHIIDTRDVMSNSMSDLTTKATLAVRPSQDFIRG